MRRRDADHNFGRGSTECQRARKNQSDQSLQSHYTLSFSSYPTANQSSGKCTTKLFSL
jgi:hypothetical protein